MTGKDIVALQTWWIGELEKIRDQVIAQDEKRKTKSHAKADKELEGISKQSDILDAYGFGCITQRKFDYLMRLWEEREKSQYPDEMVEYKLDLISEFMQMAKDCIRNSGEKVDE